MSIVISHLTKTYGTQKALDNISVETGTNHIIGFLGPNGAGKSTTMKILSGILPFESGVCLINGIDICRDPLKTKKNIGYLPENNPLYTDMYVREILAFEAQIHRLKDSKKRIDEVIGLTGLQQEQHKKVQQLSKGYKQRVGLAMAMIHDPQVLILDEPTSGLDPNQILEIRALIKELGKNKTVLLSTHIMQEVEAICEEIIVIHQGKIQDHFLLSEKESKYPGKNMEEIFVHLTHSS
ncbi:ATP-binding cassette domain-containing protein [Parapedobacter sp. SGR-10]|uniref:ATP-binding cassette domain-containing protein n=1 Tax=Parapedobacter sp. SGR-10 TaxID=2710879 RepID=UPI0013D10115|nr:ATP-binding cassette domain-containing protein [Parapedobacter sp. SGR-10]NGF56695.1 ATP-binding cassette domain-containing protein [Parapedobacter sp. SGR-10]